MRKIFTLLTFIIFCATVLSDDSTKRINVEINKQNQTVKLFKLDKNGSAFLTLTGNNGNIVLEIKDARIKRYDNIRLSIVRDDTVFHEVDEYTINDGVMITGDKAREIYSDLYNVKNLFVYRGYNLLGHYDLKNLKPKLIKYNKRFFQAI